MAVTQFNNMSNEQIIALIEDYKVQGLEAIKATCVALKELKARGSKHPYHRDRVYRWFNEVTDGRLHPGVVAMFNGNPSYLEPVIGRPLDTQKAIVAGREFDVAFERKGLIIDGRKTAAQMSIQMFRRLFPTGKPPATLAEQRKALEAEMSNKPVTFVRGHPVVKADRDKWEVRVGNTAIPLNVIKGALAEIGLSVIEQEN